MHGIITGASSGIGEALARHFAGRGWELTLVARREVRLEALAEELETRCLVCPADLSDPARADAMLARAREELGPIDLLVNNAGVQFVEPTVGIDVERMELLLAVNLRTPLRLIQRVLPEMLERGAGTIVNISSMAGVVPTPGMTHYNASKAGLGAASESLRVELEGTGVHVVSVYPGPVKSPMEQAARENIEETWAVRHLPTGEAEELARLVEEACEKKKPRVFYPKVYGLSRYTRVMSQWFTDTFTPPFDPEP